MIVKRFAFLAGETGNMHKKYAAHACRYSHVAISFLNIQPRLR
jgi:hypothetical protein